MNTKSIKDCKRMLGAKRVEILSSHDETEGIVVQRVPDSMDEISLEVQRSMAVDALNRKAALFCQVTEALERIAEGKYGVCLACQEEISPKRLAALPWAALCFECQQATENGASPDAKASGGLRLGYSVSNNGHQPGKSTRRNTHRLRRQMISRASTNGGATESEARL